MGKSGGGGLGFTKKVMKCTDIPRIKLLGYFLSGTTLNKQEIVIYFFENGDFLTRRSGKLAVNANSA